jgi:hypothetical protein
MPSFFFWRLLVSLVMLNRTLNLCYIYASPLYSFFIFQQQEIVFLLLTSLNMPFQFVFRHEHTLELVRFVFAKPKIFCKKKKWPLITTRTAILTQKEEATWVFSGVCWKQTTKKTNVSSSFWVILAVRVVFVIFSF